MLESLLVVAQQVGILFALMAVGFLCNRTKLLSETVVRGMVDLLVLVVTPCLIVHAFERPFEVRLLAGLGWALGAAIGVHLLGILASFCIRHGDKRRESVLRFAVIFSNAGFMGIPLESALLGNDGVFYGAVYVTVFNLVCWSYGLVIMAGGMRDVRARTLFVNPGSIGIACGLPFFLFSCHLPPVLDEPVRMMADLNTPVAMIVIGWYLAAASFRPALECGAAYLAGLLRLIVIPSVVLCVIWLCNPAEPAMAAATVVAASAPVAALTTMFAARYERDVAVSVGLVSVTTLLSIITMPPLVGCAMWLFGLR